MSKRARAGSTLAVVAAIVATITVSAGTVAAKSAGRKDSGTLYITIVHQAGGLLYAAGLAQDRVMGPVAVVYTVSVRPGGNGSFHITAKKVILYTRTGSISGTGSATQTVTSSSDTVSGGKLNLTHGAGGQAGHSFAGTFSGTYDSKAGAYTFHYSGTYR